MTEKESITKPGMKSTPNSPQKQRKYKMRGLKRSQSIGHNIGSNRHEYGISTLNMARRVRCFHSRSNENLWLVGSMESFHTQVKRRQESGDGDGYNSGKSSHFSHSVDNLEMF